MNSERIPVTLALALLAAVAGWWHPVEASDCVQKILPPPNIDSVFQSSGVGFGMHVFSPNELTTVVWDNYNTWPSANNYYGGVWIYRRENTSAEFEFLQFIGNGTLYQTVVTAFGAGDSIVVGGRVNIAIPRGNYTALIYDEDEGQYVVDQVLEPGGTSYGAYSNGAIGAMCSDWIFADFVVGSATALLSFYRNPDSQAWVKHNTVTTYSGADYTGLIGVSPSCTRLVTRTSIAADKFMSFKFSVADNNWILTQNWPTPSAGTEKATSIAVGDTRLYTAASGGRYNMTAENQPTNPNNLTSVAGAGSVSEYLWNGTHFVLNIEQLFQPNPGYNANCGLSMSLGGNTLVVGCPFYNTSFSFDEQCEEYPKVCNKTTCAVTLGGWSGVNQYLFIRGRVDQYALNSETGEFEFATSRDEVCNSSLPWQCNSGSSYGRAVATINDEVFVGAPADWAVGQLYVYGPTIECEKCPCKTDPPCENGGTCHETVDAPFFFCECPKNFTGVHCGEPYSPSSSAPSQWAAWGVAIALGSVVLVGAVVTFAVLGSKAAGPAYSKVSGGSSRR